MATIKTANNVLESYEDLLDELYALFTKSRAIMVMGDSPHSLQTDMANIAGDCVDHAKKTMEHFRTLCIGSGIIKEEEIDKDYRLENMGGCIPED